MTTIETLDRGVFMRTKNQNLYVKWGNGIPGGKGAKKNALLSRCGKADFSNLSKPSRAYSYMPPRAEVQYLMPDKFLRGTGLQGGWWGKYL